MATTQNPQRECGDSRCSKPARCAIRTTRPTRADMRVTIYADDRVAPKSATPYCHEHGVHLAKELTEVLVDGDD